MGKHRGPDVRRALFSLFLGATLLAVSMGLLEVWLFEGYGKTRGRIVSTAVILAVASGALLLVIGATFGPHDDEDGR